jgi:hypothetical protein
MKKSSIFTLTQTAALIGLVTCFSACTTNATKVNVPENLKAPADQAFSFETSAKGVQIYTCTPNKTDATKFEWTFVAPEAELFDVSGAKVGKHYAGPSWESNDGSKVIGEVVSRADSPDANAIPWLLLKAKSNSGNGVYTPVKSIQRVATVAGKAPATGCDAANNDKEVRIDYQARYYFFVAK